MTTVNICGWEGGDTSEVLANGGTFSVQSTTKRTGTFALRCNPASNTAGFNTFGRISVTGLHGGMSDVTEQFYTFYFRFGSIPSGTVRFAKVGVAGGAELVRLNCDSSGNITITGTTTSSVIATISAGTWYLMELRATISATCGAKINGGSERTVTGNANASNHLCLGREITTEAVAFDCYYDDMSINNTAPSGAGEVRQILPTGVGNYTGWVTGTGTTFAECDEVPHNSDTDYIAVPSTEGNTAKTFAMQDCITVGIVGTIRCVKNTAVLRTESTTSSSSIGVRIRSGSTDNNSSASEVLTTYQRISKMHDNNPDGSVPWTRSALDAVECGVFASTIAQAQRCTVVSAMVWCEGVNPTIVMPGVASLVTNTFAPSVQVLSPVVVTPGTSSLITTRFAPTIRLSILVTPGVKNLVTQTFAPTVAVAAGAQTIEVPAANLITMLFAPVLNLGIIPGVRDLATTTFPPTVQTPKVLIPGAASLITAGFAPTILTPVTVYPGPRTLVLITFAPNVVSPRIVRPDNTTLITTGFSPTVQTPRSVIPSAASLVMTAFAPNVGTTAHIIVVVPAASLALQTFTPLALTPILVTPETANLIIETFAPDIIILAFEFISVEAFQAVTEQLKKAVSRISIQNYSGVEPKAVTPVSILRLTEQSVLSVEQGDPV